MMITEADLNWWLDLAPTLEWTYAKTMPYCPHSYVVASRSPLTHDDFVRAARVIHTFGQPAKFYRRTSIYLTSRDRTVKWWTMDCVLASTDLINQATTDRMYGPQNAPSTASGLVTPYDGIAVTYDASTWWPDAMAELREISRLAPGLGEAKVLDIGAGTGRLLDSGLVAPQSVTAVDPSGPMLNELVRKHPAVAAVAPVTAAQFLDSDSDGSYDVVTAIGGTGSYLDVATLERLAAAAQSAFVVSHFTGDRAPHAYGGHHLPEAAAGSRVAARDLADQRGGEVAELAGLQLCLIPA